MPGVSVTVVSQHEHKAQDMSNRGAIPLNSWPTGVGTATSIGLWGSSRSASLIHHRHLATLVSYGMGLVRMSRPRRKTRPDTESRSAKTRRTRFCSGYTNRQVFIRRAMIAGKPLMLSSHRWSGAQAICSDTGTRILPTPTISWRSNTKTRFLTIYPICQSRSQSTNGLRRPRYLASSMAPSPCECSMGIRRRFRFFRPPRQYLKSFQSARAQSRK
jgi:hypothetical protein